MLPAASSTPVSHSSMSAAEFGAENLLRPLSQIRLSLKGCEERQVSALLGMLRHSAADQLQGWPQLSLGQPDGAVPRASRSWTHFTDRRRQRTRWSRRKLAARPAPPGRCGSGGSGCGKSCASGDRFPADPDVDGIYRPAPGRQAGPDRVCGSPAGPPVHATRHAQFALPPPQPVGGAGDPYQRQAHRCGLRGPPLASTAAPPVPAPVD
jgi:hypothetical protein